MVAVEAMLMDVPVITMDFCDELHGVEFIDAGATLHATSIADIEFAFARRAGMPPADGTAASQRGKFFCAVRVLCTGRPFCRKSCGFATIHLQALAVLQSIVGQIESAFAAEFSAGRKHAIQRTPPSTETVCRGHPRVMMPLHCVLQGPTCRLPLRGGTWPRT